MTREDGDRPHGRRHPFSDDELAGPLSEYPPVLRPDEAAELLRVSTSTLYGYVSSGRLRRCVKRGKPLRFWRDRLVREFFRL